MEATSTLADALLDDLDDLSDVGEETNEADEVYLGAVDDAFESEASSSVNQLKGHSHRMLSDPAIVRHIQTIREIMGGPTASNSASLHAASSKDDKDVQEANHQLLVQSNRALRAASHDLTTAHSELCKAYEPKFPELEELIPNATQYIKAVRSIGNETDLTNRSVNDSLNAFLSNHQIITLSVAASTTSGRTLTTEELQQVDRIATYMEDVLEVTDLLTRYVEQQMEGTAPNMHALVGAATSAKLLALTGGLAALSKIPACNLQVLGQVKHGRNGIVASVAYLTETASQPHQGVLAQTELVQRCPRHLRQKALKIVAAKLALAIRCDFVNVEAGRSRTSASGEAFRQQIEAKFATWLEPDKAPVLRSLPKPDLTVKKRRGGKRMRRLKERFEETALMKQANTRAFSTQAGEYGDDAMGKTLGLLDASAEAGGAVRRNTAEKRKMTYANTRASRKKAAINAQAASANTSGLASSMVFTPVQGMELVNPDAARDRVKEANRKWFSDNAGFQSALPKK